MAPFFNSYVQQPQQQFFPQTQQQMMPQQQMQNTGFISVRSESDAYNYPVGPGNCMTFKVEGQPIVIEKSMGFSQLEAPKVERYKLVKESMSQNHYVDQNEHVDTHLIENTIDELKAEIEQIRADVDDLKTKSKQSVKKAAVKSDE